MGHERLESKAKKTNPTIKFIAETLHRSRRTVGGYSDLVLFAAKLLETYNPDECMFEKQMRARANEVLDSMYNRGQQTIKGDE